MSKSRLTGNGWRRQHCYVGVNVDYDRTIALQCLLERRAKLRCSVDADAESPDSLGDPREVHIGVRPEFSALRCRLPFIGPIETTFGLIASAIVIDHRNGVDVPPDRSFNFGQVVPEPGVSGEHQRRTLRRGALGS